MPAISLSHSFPSLFLSLFLARAFSIQTRTLSIALEASTINILQFHFRRTALPSYPEQNSLYTNPTGFVGVDWKKTIAAIALHYIWSRRGIDFRLCFSCLHPANSLDSCTCIKRAECTGLVWPERRNAIISMIYDSQCSLYFKRLFFPCPLLGVLDS